VLGPQAVDGRSAIAARWSSLSNSFGSGFTFPAFISAIMSELAPIP